MQVHEALSLHTFYFSGTLFKHSSCLAPPPFLSPQISKCSVLSLSSPSLCYCLKLASRDWAIHRAHIVFIISKITVLDCLLSHFCNTWEELFIFVQVFNCLWWKGKFCIMANLIKARSHVQRFLFFCSITFDF